MKHRFALSILTILFIASAAYSQANGKLQIHFMDVGQGDGAVLISPLGEVVLFDNGVQGNCDKPVSYLQQLGITKIDYHITSHYHSDHFGCTTEVLQEFPLIKDALDRGGIYSSQTFKNYLIAVGTHRKKATEGMIITLDAGSASPVSIKIAALNGNGVSTTNENDLSVVAKIHFGNFDAEIGGDLSGFKTDYYEDIETSVAPKVGKIEVYKVHHHGSRYSSNQTWLQKTTPIIGIISTGVGNDYGHPTQECLERLHAGNVLTYWTERGMGADPEPGYDTVGGNIIVEMTPGSQTFTVTHSGSQVDTYYTWETRPTPNTVSPASAITTPQFAWSKKSKVYHYANCKYVDNISPGNLERGNTPPPDKELHKGCPKK